VWGLGGVFLSRPGKINRTNNSQSKALAGSPGAPIRDENNTKSAMSEPGFTNGNRVA